MNSFILISNKEIFFYISNKRKKKKDFRDNGVSEYRSTDQQHPSCLPLRFAYCRFHNTEHRRKYPSRFCVCVIHSYYK